MALSYLHPGVYVEEVPSAVKPIAGVGTSTAAFLGVVPDTVPLAKVTNASIGVGDGTTKTFPVSTGAVSDAAGSFEFRVAGAADTSAEIAEDTDTGGSSVTFDNAPAAGARIRGDYTPEFEPAAAGELHKCTSFGDYTEAFGSFSTDAGHRNLTHAVYGFFANGGTTCYVGRETAAGNFATSTLPRLEAFDDVAIVAAPGVTDAGARSAIVTHCAVRTQDRFAILDLPEAIGTGAQADLTLLSYDTQGNVLPQPSDYAAVYFPWLQVADPATGGTTNVPPSGHLAGVYARVDATRGVHKAPANEPVMGITGLRYAIGDAQQDGLNPQGVNAIRMLGGAPLVWGARTLGGDENEEWRYIAARRLFLFLRSSIYRGTGWVVFEPNDASLWAKIIRNVTAFLTNVWRDGGLFGATADKAFYVKCDAETNPASVRDAGQVITEIGVALVAPAEFVVFRISQWAQSA